MPGRRSPDFDSLQVQVSAHDVAIARLEEHSKTIIDMLGRCATKEEVKPMARAFYAISGAFMLALADWLINAFTHHKP